MRYKVLHIPSGNSFQVIGAHAKTLERFKEEFKVCIYYTRTPITQTFNVRHLKAQTMLKLKRLGFHYKRSYMDLSQFWMAQFAVFAANNSLDIYEELDIINLRTKWPEIVGEEYEVMSD